MLFSQKKRLFKNMDILCLKFSLSICFLVFFLLLLFENSNNLEKNIEST